MKTFPALYIDPSGVIRYIAECPEEPKYGKYDDGYMGYQQAIGAAKESAIEVADQGQAKELIFYELYGGPQVDIPWTVVVKNHSEKLFELPERWSVETKETSETLSYPSVHTGSAVNHTVHKTVAVLIPPDHIPDVGKKVESQEDIWYDVLRVQEEMGHSEKRVIPELMKYFTITRK